MGIEVQNLRMKTESLSSRLDFSERRVRALEGVVQYRPEAVRSTERRGRRGRGTGAAGTGRIGRRLRARGGTAGPGRRQRKEAAETQARTPRRKSGCPGCPRGLWRRGRARFDTAAATIRLPDHLAAEPFLRELYGTVAWGVRAVYDRLTGWFDGSPATLDPRPARTAPRRRRARRLRPARRRGRARHDEGRHQLALELASIVLDVDPRDPEANEVTIDACCGLRAAATSINAKGFYTTGIRLSQQRLESPSGD